MGNTFNGTAIRETTGDFLDILQKEGLGQLQSKNFALGIWNNHEVFGYSHSRNQNFKQMLDYLSPLFREGFKAANQNPGMASRGRHEFVAKHLAHHVMKCLLEGHSNVDVSLNELKKDNLDLSYELPKYPQDKLDALVKQFTTLKHGKVLSLETKDEGEKEVLSAKLADMVSNMLRQIDVKKIVCDALKKHIALEQSVAKNKASLYYNHTENPDQLIASRKQYTQEEEIEDLKKTVEFKR